MHSNREGKRSPNIAARAYPAEIERFQSAAMPTDSSRRPTTESCAHVVEAGGDNYVSARTLSSRSG